MSKQNKTNNGPQKGARRERLKKHQNNRGNDHNPPEYKNFNDEPIE